MKFTQFSLEDVERIIKDKRLASEAYVVLEQLREQKAISIYRPHGWSLRQPHWWNVYNHASETRFTLKEWCAQWLAGRTGGAE